MRPEGWSNPVKEGTVAINASYTTPLDKSPFYAHSRRSEWDCYDNCLEEVRSAQMPTLWHGKRLSAG